MDNNINKMESNTNIMAKSTNNAGSKATASTSMKYLLCETAKEWRGPYETEEDIADNILEQAARFASELLMPDLNPIMVAVCTYARVTQSEAKVNAVLDAMKDLNDLAKHITSYRELLGILEWTHGRRLAESKGEEVDDE